LRLAIQSEQTFNLMLLGSGIKFDLVVRKSGGYRQTESARRQFITFGPVRACIASRDRLP